MPSISVAYSSHVGVDFLYSDCCALLKKTKYFLFVAPTQVIFLSFLAAMCYACQSFFYLSRTLQDYCRKGKKKEERSITHHTAQRSHIILTMEV